LISRDADSSLALSWITLSGGLESFINSRAVGRISIQQHLDIALSFRAFALECEYYAVVRFKLDRFSNVRYRFAEVVTLHNGDDAIHLFINRVLSTDDQCDRQHEGEDGKH